MLRTLVLTLVLLCAGCTTPRYQELEADSCATVEACIQRVFEIAEPPSSPGIWLNDKESALALRLQEFGQNAVPPLVQLLAEPDENVARFGAAALRDIDHIDARFPPQIVAGLDRKLPWLPPALANIDSPDAAEEAVKRLLVSRSAPHNQEAVAVRKSGARAIPLPWK